MGTKACWVEFCGNIELLCLILQTRATPHFKLLYLWLFDLYHFSVIKWPPNRDSFPFVRQVVVNKGEKCLLFLSFSPNVGNIPF